MDPFATSWLTFSSVNSRLTLLVVNDSNNVDIIATTWFGYLGAVYEPNKVQIDLRTIGFG